MWETWLDSWFPVAAPAGGHCRWQGRAPTEALVLSASQMHKRLPGCSCCRAEGHLPTTANHYQQVRRGLLSHGRGRPVSGTTGFWVRSADTEAQTLLSLRAITKTRAILQQPFWVGGGGVSFCLCHLASLTDGTCSEKCAVRGVPLVPALPAITRRCDHTGPLSHMCSLCGTGLW